MAKKDTPINNGLTNLMNGIPTATTKTVGKLIEPSTQKNLNEPSTTEIKKEQSPALATENIIAEETNKETNEDTLNEALEETSLPTAIEETNKEISSEAAEDISNETITEDTNKAVEEEIVAEETSSLPKNKKFQVNIAEEDLKSLNHAVRITGLKRTRLVNQMLEFALTCKDDFIKYHSEKNKEPVISSVTKDQEGRPKFCVKTVKKSRKDNFLLIASSDLIDKVDILAKELEISRNKFVNEAILFALESM